MNTVWAFSRFRQVAIDWKAGNGWKYCWPIESLDALGKLLVEHRLFGTVSRLGINVHGQGGFLNFREPVGIDYNPAKLQGAFMNIVHHLTADAWVVFYACNVGNGEKGDRFLALLSTLLPQRTIVGFEQVSHGYGGQGSFTPAGRMFVKVLVPTRQGGYEDRVDDLTEYHDVAKWARSGEIVRPPKSEVVALQGDAGTLGKRTHSRMQNAMGLCGSKLCPGHGTIGHWCTGYQRSAEFMVKEQQLREKLDDVWQLYEKVYGPGAPAVRRAQQAAAKRKGGR